MSKYYTPSGKFDPKALLYFALIAIIALPLLGLAYAYAIWYIPFIYINFIIAGAFGFIIAFLISAFVIRIGKVRNKKLAIGLSVLAALIALYCHWVVWVDLVLNISDTIGGSRIGIAVSNVQADQLLAIASNPLGMFELMGAISEVGTWEIRSATVSGLLLIIIWLIEAVIIIGATVLFTNGASEPFCELGNEWFESKELPAFNYIANRPQLVQDLEQSNPDAFKSLSYAASAEKDHSVFVLYSSNHNENYLTVSNKRANHNKDGDLEFDENVLIEHIYLNGELKEKLINFKESITAEPTAEKPDNKNPDSTEE